MFNNVYPREKYLKKIRPFYDSDIIKVITGIRRCGKSFILKAIMNELIDRGIPKTQIIYIPLDRRGYKNIKTSEELETKIESMLGDDENYYLFIDEVQNVFGFESVIHAYAEEGYSIFLTGSNSYLLSDEISTKLTGRYLNFETFTLDFSEYLEMKRFFKKKIDQDIYVEFEEYILNGGFPKTIEFDDIQARQTYTRGIISEIFEKDVKTRKRISNVPVYERVQSFLLNNYSAPFSLSNLLECLEKEGYKTKATTVRGYIEDLKKAKIIYECNRFDLKSKKSLRREQKYYLSDLAIYFAMNTDNRLSYGPSLENMVYLYLASQDYQISIGKIGKLECDFITRNTSGDYAYIQVTYTMQGEDIKATERIKEREYRPFRKIRDGYPRYIVSLDRFRDQQEGVHHINAIDLFLGKEKI
ncbi:ATP-binding protein [Coprobacillus sp. TM10-10]|uniref:ATP-binding protein n=1 Tax=Faecalibacillus intestinalis TaxID=1982626 RepID=A0A2T3FYB6_9FIRM|nr:ATP-binding protein [Faecalibacillus intestinalis]MBS6796584.1 ATP-binding protein [Coprobacillus sp.]RGE95787.1 ATP-binding protein [Coprobacillus sp. AM23-9LB]RGF27977.1 ATP-binding protein [Coprobacillus sp. AM09-26]RGF85198.1 ATP-binding protein [Coprobacillus sp. OF02-11LB]RGG05905.1 ATP-binding protein [Coprobacillus sp. AF27-24BH]RGG81391.1 ATP-binding protein [Coprobacillus sp. AF17-17AC]RGG84518.1 ATP-binding protein [Coprobacillus sp. AF17-11AC]RGG96009.1 ATP-binding protein [C